MAETPSADRSHGWRKSRREADAIASLENTNTHLANILGTNNRPWMHTQVARPEFGAQPAQTHSTAAKRKRPGTATGTGRPDESGDDDAGSADASKGATSTTTSASVSPHLPNSSWQAINKAARPAAAVRTPVLPSPHASPSEQPQVFSAHDGNDDAIAEVSDIVFGRPINPAEAASRQPPHTGSDAAVTRPLFSTATHTHPVSIASHTTVDAGAVANGTHSTTWAPSGQSSPTIVGAAPSHRAHSALQPTAQAASRLPPQSTASSAQVPSPTISNGRSSDIVMSLEACRQALRQFIASLAKPLATVGPDYSKLRLIEFAIAHNDFDFLAANQFLALWALGKLQIPPGSIPLPEKHGKIIDSLLVSTASLSPTVLHFCAKLPFVRQTPVAGRYDHFGARLEEFRQTCESIALKLPDFTPLYLKRGFGPFPHAQLELTGIRSIVIQQLIFRTITASAWGAGHQFIEKACTAFVACQSRCVKAKWAPGQVKADEGALLAHLLHLSAQYGPRAHQPALPASQLRTAQGQFQPAPPRIVHTRPLPVQPNQILSSQSGLGIQAQSPPIPSSHSFPYQMTSPGVLGTQPPTFTNYGVLVPSNATPQGISNHANAAPMPHVTNSSIWHPVHAQIAPRTTQAVEGNAIKPPKRGPFVPGAHDTTMQLAIPEPGRTAIHLLHLNPAQLVLKPSSTTKAQRLYQSATRFLLEPIIAHLDLSVVRFTFNVTDDDALSLPQAQKADAISGEVFEISKESISLQLRAVQTSKLVSKGKAADEGDWATAETSWPKNVAMKINGHWLDVRRKLHFGKDRAANIDHLVKAGENELILYCNESASSPLRAFAYAVEVLEHDTHSNIVSSCQHDRALSAEEVKSAFGRKRSRGEETADGEGDDLQVVSSSMHVNLFDPITACSIPQIPVRGRRCPHNSCFDLETFLNTRSLLNEGGPSSPNEWKCPICGGDARPCNLIVDGFMMQVKEELAKRGALDTRAIVVDTDGSWEIKSGGDVIGRREKQPEDGKRSDSLTTQLLQATASDKQSGTNADSSFIILDD